MEKEHNMAGTVAIGIQQFNEIRKKGYFYIDKTAFIREWWEEQDVVTLIKYEKRYQTSSESFGIFFRVITFW